MSTENAATGGDLEAAPIVSAPNLDGGESFSVEQAFEAYQKRNTPAESAEPATAEQESAEQADAGPEEVPSETSSEDAADDLPPIDPPRSWTKEDKELFNSLPRETQERLAERERSREGDFLRRQNEAAESNKALEAELAKAKQAREQYEAKQAAYTKTLEDALQAEFGDIQTMHDVRKLQAEDPFRFQAWQLRQMELAQAQAEKQSNDHRSVQEKQSAWAKFVQDESKAFAEAVPEFKAKETEYTKKAAEVLGDLGFTESELSKLASGEEKISLFDRRMQRLLFDRIRFSEIKAAPPKAIPKPVPAVQKPGVTPPKGAHATQDVQALRNKLHSSGSVEDAYALYQAKQRRNAPR